MTPRDVKTFFPVKEFSEPFKSVFESGRASVAQAGASRVIAVEASEKMAAVATQVKFFPSSIVVKCTSVFPLIEFCVPFVGFGCRLQWTMAFGGVKAKKKGNKHSTGVIEVVQGMVEELDKSSKIQPHSVNVLLSEWMGYCVLYESILSSVLFARDRWLKPGGAIVPDTATIFVAGFGKGGTSDPFWENVYGFNMSCIGKELVGDAAKIPIVDIVDNHDIVTNSTVLQTFDLATMNHDDVDFTASAELEPYSAGILAAIGTEACPAMKIQLRVSIARAVEHRSIDISLETVGIGSDGRKCKWPF
ncbi:putative protein arginine n-methyltransferase 3 [Quercus suber]|uniref:Protein arginine N-methyltransferase domain-containing protein n=1 Tax=Quercus suber TaxID=58331 RepID=A0AAW0M040_QUESU